MNQELADVQAGFRKGRGTRDQMANIRWIKEKARELKKKKSASLTRLKPLTVWLTTNWKILQEMGIPDHLTCLLRILYAGKEATVRTRHGTTDWFQIGKGVLQGCVLSPCLFNLHASCQMPCWMTHKLESRLLREISTTSDTQMIPPLWLSPESEEELKSLLMKVKEESKKADLKLNIQKTRIIASSPITSWQIDGDKVET